ncbi:DUF6838 family protein [Pectinatus frisingensis]|uniref:phage tail terminator family protein n=1 Tax=Pectinatus frisingensis TaxID=865 RepID=UPI0018C4F2A1|nr:hypothetical protein [Pectinatus frisingensis]
MLKQKEILQAVINLLEAKYENITTYTDEITRGFKQPCFFIKLIKSKNTETKNVNSNSLSIIITYFADDTANKQLAYLDCEDDINVIFGNGFQVGDRYLHIDTISAERIGENQDILQITLTSLYFDSTSYDGSAGYDLMLHLNNTLVNKNSY